jgi:zinc protease
MPRRADTKKDRAEFLKQAAFYEETPYVTKVVLKNGMTVLVYEYKIYPVVSVQAYVRAGSFHDPSQNPGLARLLASLVHRGSANQSMGTFRQQVHTMGGRFRSSTGYEHTLFEIVAASSQWENALKLQADALLNPSLDAAVIRQEADLLIEQTRGFTDDPRKFAREALLELGFSDRRVTMMDLTGRSSLREISKKQLMDFHKARYTPAGVTLVVAGDVRSSDILNEVARIYGGRSGPDPSRASKKLKSGQREFRYRAFRGDVPFPILLFGFHTVSETNEDYRALEVLSAILGLGKGSVLFSRLADQKKIIYSEETTLTALPDCGYLTVQMEVDPENIDRSEIAALTMMELLKRAEPGKADMERAIAQLERSYWKRMETATERGEMLANFEAMGDWKRMNRYISELRSVAPSDVKRVAERYLRLENCSLLEYLPDSMEKRDLTTDMVFRTLESLIKASADQEQAERSAEIVYAAKPPKETDEYRFSEIRYPIQLASILRGPDMLMREDHTSPLVDMGIFFPGGKRDENQKNAGITELMLDLMLRCDTEKSAVGFCRQLEVYGGSVQPFVADDYFGFYFTILSKNFAEGFGLLQEAIKAPEFSEDSVERQKEIQHAEIVRRNKSVFHPKQIMKQHLFKDFYYSLHSEGNLSNLSGITRASLQAWYDAHVKNKKPLVIAIGDAEGTSLAAHFVRHFSGSRMQDIKISEEYAKPLEKGESLEQNWGKSKSLILVGFQAPPLDDVDRHAAGMIQGYFGGAGRLSQAIRDGKGAAYEIDAAYEPKVRGGSMILYAATNPGKEDEALEFLRDEIVRAINDPITRREFRSAINAAIGAYRINTQKRYTQIARLAENKLAGHGIEEYEGWIAGLREVTEEDFRYVARRIFSMDKAIIIRVIGKSD